MGTLTKALIGKEDMNFADSELYPTTTFTRVASLGGTMTMTYMPNLMKTHYPVINARFYGGSAGALTQATIESALAAIGTSNKRVLLIEPGTWVYSSNANYSGYSNVYWMFMPGAIISHGAYTLSFKNIEAGLYQIFSGTGAVTYPGKKYPEWWGAKDDSGSTDSTTAIQAAVTAGGEIELTAPNGSYYKLSNEITISSAVRIYSNNRAKLVQTTAGKRFFVSSDINDITIKGLIMQGLGSSDTYSAEWKGAINLVNTAFATGKNLVVEDNEIYDVYNGIMIYKAYNLSIKNNTVRSYLLYGISASKSEIFAITNNFVYDNEQTGAANAYGIHATGDHTAGDIQIRNVIANNVIYNIPAWSGIMSHNTASVLIVGNDISNVRTGIDIGPITGSTDRTENITITGNHVRLTATNTWGATAAQHCGIGIVGIADTATVGVVVSGNLIEDFGTGSDMVLSGNVYAPIKLEYVNQASITGNVIRNIGEYGAGAAVGLYICNYVTITGNTVESNASNYGIAYLRNAASGSSVVTAGFTIVGNFATLTGASSLAVEFAYGTYNLVTVQNNSHNGQFAYQYKLTTAVVNWAKPQIQVGVYTAGDATPTVAGISFLSVTNSGATNITMFDDGVEGQQITLYFAEANSTLVHNATYIILSGGANLTPTANDILKLVKYGGQWYQAAPIAANPS